MAQWAVGSVGSVGTASHTIHDTQPCTGEMRVKCGHLGIQIIWPLASWANDDQLLPCRIQKLRHWKQRYRGQLHGRGVFVKLFQL